MLKYIEQIILFLSIFKACAPIIQRDCPAMVLFHVTHQVFRPDSTYSLIPIAFIPPQVHHTMRAPPEEGGLPLCCCVVPL